MTFSEIFFSSLRALFTNKVRSFLTMLGVIIGVFAVVALVSLVQGIKNYVTDRFNELGSNLIIVSPGRVALNQDPAVSFANNNLEIKHIDLIRQYAGDYILGVTPSIRVGKPVVYKSKNYYSAIVGANWEAENIVDVVVANGRFFTKTEEDSKSRVAVIGANIKKELFESTDPLGKRIKIGNTSFEVIGVLAPKNSQYDDRIFMPYTTIRDSLDIKQVSGFLSKAKDSKNLPLTAKQIEIALLKDLKKDDFTVLTQQDVLGSFESILSILSAGLAAVAAISLLVGGIGIMNIMLVSVTERISEIGLRKAVGATPVSIYLQFMFESIMISVFGGVGGLILGWVLTLAVSNFLRAEVPWWAAFLSLGFSSFVGIVFGTYPAIKAAKKDPIEALRYE